MQSDSEITGFGLNRQAIIELYKDTGLYLVSEARAYDGFDFTGANLRNVLILLPQELRRYEQSVQDMLMKMLAAIGLGINDVAIVNVTQYPGLRYSSLAEFFSPGAVMFLGIFPAALGITLEKYMYLHTGETAMVYADNLDDISSNVPLKNKLWLVLKEHFMFK